MLEMKAFCTAIVVKLEKYMGTPLISFPGPVSDFVKIETSKLIRVVIFIQRISFTNHVFTICCDSVGGCRVFLTDIVL